MRVVLCRVLCFASLGLALVGGTRASARDHPKLPPGTEDTVRTRASDPRLFEKLRSSQWVLAAWLDSMEVAECDPAAFKPGHLGCQRFEIEPSSVAPAVVQRLLRLLPRCIWTRPAPRTALDCGLQLRGPTAWVDIGINVDSMSLTVFTAGDAPARGSPRPELASELAWVAVNIPVHQARSRLKVDLLTQRWSSAMTASLGSPCDKSDQAEDGEFVYYEEPPVPIRQPAPVSPVGPAIQGSRKVVLHALVRKDGRVCTVKVIRGNPLLAAAAIDAVREWEWKPAQSNNKPVAVWVEVPIDVP